MTITKDQILDALRNVEDPDLKKDLVTLGMIQDITIDGSKIYFSVVLTTPACPMKNMIEQACRNAITHFISKDLQININMTAKVASHSNNLDGIKHIILVSSGKGGVGKSTVSANLAISLALNGAKVGLIDADIYGPSIPTMFDEIHAKPKALAEQGGKTKIIPIVKHGIKLLSLGFFSEPGQAVPWRGPMASSAIKQMFNDADWGELDYMIVDLPPGTGDIHITISQGFPISGAIVVTSPQKVAMSDTRKGINMFKMPGVTVPILGIVENMSYFTPSDLPDKKYYLFGKGGGKALSEEFSVPFLGELPIMEQISESGDNGVPIALQTNHPVAQSFNDLAQRIAQLIAIQCVTKQEQKI